MIQISAHSTNSQEDFSPRGNFFAHWTTDHEGRWVYVGLSFEETQILMAHTGVKLNGDLIEFVDEVPYKDRALISELTLRHETARQEAVRQFHLLRFGANESKAN